MCTPLFQTEGRKSPLKLHYNRGKSTSAWLGGFHVRHYIAPNMAVVGFRLVSMTNLRNHTPPLEIYVAVMKRLIGVLEEVGFHGVVLIMEPDMGIEYVQQVYRGKKNNLGELLSRSGNGKEKLLDEKEGKEETTLSNTRGYRLLGEEEQENIPLIK